MGPGRGDSEYAERKCARRVWKRLPDFSAGCCCAKSFRLHFSGRRPELCDSYHLAIGEGLFAGLPAQIGGTGHSEGQETNAARIYRLRCCAPKDFQTNKKKLLNI